MTKISKRALESKQLSYYINDLWSAFTLMGSKEDIRLLFKDIFTHTEYKMFAKRLQIARMLLDGQTYDQISDVLKVTPITIAHVSNTLANKGYGFRRAHIGLSRIEEKFHKKRVERQKNIENPFRARVMKNVLTQEKAGELAAVVTKPLSSAYKKNSAKDHLNV
jgi:TrpR-related protein YerC/YecD